MTDRFLTGDARRVRHQLADDADLSRQLVAVAHVRPGIAAAVEINAAARPVDRETISRMGLDPYAVERRTRIAHEVRGRVLKGSLTLQAGLAVMTATVLEDVA